MADAAASLDAARTPASVRRDGERLVFSGALDRPACASVWKQVQPLRAGVRTLDLTAVSTVDSAGLALLAELAALDPRVRLLGSPVGLDELRAAYRLDDGLAFAS
ncbi:MAG: STAS domain-containing protein [Luteimonas sp.]